MKEKQTDKKQGQTVKNEGETPGSPIQESARILCYNFDELAAYDRKRRAPSDRLK